ncbi:hypothetical protein B0H10DRAFT_1960357 [Mycena sp. CBHHK59/15]|nr:hypothetical protein B0H10DRAFT_1960357 [Mycena sp. CBHHK59/15]
MLSGQDIVHEYTEAVEPQGGLANFFPDIGTHSLALLPGMISKESDLGGINFCSSIGPNDSTRQEKPEFVRCTKCFSIEDNMTVLVARNIAQVFFVAVPVHPKRAQTRNMGKARGREDKVDLRFVVVDYRAKEPLPQLVITADIDCGHLGMNQCYEDGLLHATPIENGLVHL